MAGGPLVAVEVTTTTPASCALMDRTCAVLDALGIPDLPVLVKANAQGGNGDTVTVDTSGSPVCKFVPARIRPDTFKAVTDDQEKTSSDFGVACVLLLGEASSFAQAQTTRYVSAQRCQPGNGSTGLISYDYWRGAFNASTGGFGFLVCGLEWPSTGAVAFIEPINVNYTKTSTTDDLYCFAEAHNLNGYF